MSERDLDRDLAEHYDPTRQVEYDNRSACPDLLGQPDLVQLVQDAALQGYLGMLLDLDTVVVDDGQIAIRNTNANVPPEPHIDGIPTATNGMVEDELTPFTLLIGIFLSEVTREFAGSFTVWPGSHLVLESYFNSRGRRAKREGMPQVSLGTPTQLLCSTGDVVLCHYSLAHAAAVNTSGFNRYAVFFRVTQHDLLDQADAGSLDAAWAHLTSIWTGWNIIPS